MNIRGLLLLFTVIGFYIPELSAQTLVTTAQETLRGLKGFSVIIGELHDEVTQAGLTKSILKTDVELKLRKAGIRVLTKDERFFTLGLVGRLSVSVNALKTTSPPHTFVYCAAVKLLQDVILSRNRVKTLAITWDSGFVGVTPDLRDVRENTSNLVDMFMNDYLAVNPK